MSDFSKLPHDIADCMSRAGAPLSDDQKLLLAGYLAPVQQQLEQAQARCAELEAREDAMCDLNYANGAKQGFNWGQENNEKALAECVNGRVPPAVAEKAGGGDA